jgi:hypothetical protein
MGSTMHSEARRNLEAHIQGERNRDLDALMAPLSDVPRYVVPGWVLEGRVAVRTMYERAMPLLSPELSDEYLRALDDRRVAHWGDEHVVLEYTEDYPLHRGMVVVVHFDAQGRILSENTYFANPSLLARFPADAYEGVPGAARL